jgi:hypothetical protein
MGSRGEKCQREIEELHQFFMAWFTGSVAESDASFRRFEDVLDDGFELVTPDGETRKRAPLVAGLRALYGSRPDGFKIWIREFRSRTIAPGIELASYEEWQRTAGGETSRISSAVFRESEDCPNAVAWVRVHETWRR